MKFEKIKILGAVLELPVKKHCQFCPFGSSSEINGLDWQWCLAGSSKTAPEIFIFSIAIDADYSYEVKNSDIWAPAFFKHNNSFIAAMHPAKFAKIWIFLLFTLTFCWVIRTQPISVLKLFLLYYYLGTFSKIIRNLQLVKLLNYKYVRLLLDANPIVDIPTWKWPSDQM